LDIASWWAHTPALGNLIRICPFGQLLVPTDPDNLQAAMKHLRRLALVLLLLPQLASGQTPTLVQHDSSSNTHNNSMSSPYCYIYYLPNPTTAGNAVLVGYTNNSNNPTPTITDDAGDSYSRIENYQDSTDNQAISIAAAFHVAANARKISICFPSSTLYVQAVASEFANVTGVDGSGTGNNGTGTSITAGSLTPTAIGDLAYQVTFNLNITQGGFSLPSSSSFMAGSQTSITWSLLSADLIEGFSAQYGVYNSTSAINPTMAMGTSQKWVSGAVLLKAGNAGSNASGMRIITLEHNNIPWKVGGGGTGVTFPNPTTLQFPSVGNLLVAVVGGGRGQYVTSITDSNSNTWVQAGSTITTGNDTVAIWYAANASPSLTLALTVNWNGNTSDQNIFLYDVTGAAASPLDVTNGTTGSQGSTTGTLTVPYTITPSRAGELIFTIIIWDYNTATGLTSNIGNSYFDANMFSGESLDGPEPIDENNGWGHARSTSTSAITFTWLQLNSSDNAQAWASMAAAFKSGSSTPPPAPPTRLTATVQ
jgi:hypothetical protein